MRLGKGSINKLIDEYKLEAVQLLVDLVEEELNCIETSKRLELLKRIYPHSEARILLSLKTRELARRIVFEKGAYTLLMAMESTGIRGCDDEY